ncbi:MAG TPA: hypothetical protein DCP92_17280, partial [Nitrospiraceae bacterium]|nr:hypothetical protein [Nitrospiraceae bacterium]
VPSEDPLSRSYAGLGPATASFFPFYVNCSPTAPICFALTPSELASLIKSLFFLLSLAFPVKVKESLAFASKTSVHAADYGIM